MHQALDLVALGEAVLGRHADERPVPLQHLQSSHSHSASCAGSSSDIREYRQQPRRPCTPITALMPRMVQTPNIKDCRLRSAELQGPLSALLFGAPRGLAVGEPLPNILHSNVEENMSTTLGKTLLAQKKSTHQLSQMGVQRPWQSNSKVWEHRSTIDHSSNFLTEKRTGELTACISRGLLSSRL